MHSARLMLCVAAVAAATASASVFSPQQGRILVTTADRSLQTVRSRHFLRRLYENLGIREQVSSGGSSAAAKDHDLLLDGPKD